MSAKAGAHASRRSSLPLSGATAKQNQQQQQMQRCVVNLTDNTTNSRNDSKQSSSNTKTEQPVVTVQANNKVTKQSNIADKRSQQQTTKIPIIIEKPSVSLSVKKSERNEEKKPQNGVGSVNSSTNINAEKQEKEKQQQNGKEGNVSETVKDKKDNKVEKIERSEKSATNPDKKEKLEKELEKKKEIEKEAEKEKEKLEEEVKKKEKEVEKEQEQEKERKTEEKKQKENEKKVEEKKEELAEKESTIDLEAAKPEKEARTKRICIVEVEKKSLQEKQDIEKKMPQEKRDTENKIQQESEDIEKMDISVCEDESQPQTPTKTSGNMTESNVSMLSKEPLLEPAANKASPQKTTQTTASSSNKSITSHTITIKSVTTTIDDDEMDTLPVVESTFEKAQSNKEMQPPPSVVVGPKKMEPEATSTPGKYMSFKEIFTYGSSKVSEVKPPIGTQSVDRRAFQPSQISGRRSIRSSYEPNVPNYLQTNTAYRESYRRINTELDMSSTSNTSLNVTVGSEVPNNSSFSFFGRGRKRERTPKQYTIDLDVETSSMSPKRARTEKYGFFSIVASPLSMLRSRFSKTSIQSSTPVKSQSFSNKMSDALATEEDEGEVLNVSGVSVEEKADLSVTEEVTVGNEAAEKEASRSLTPSEHISAADVEVMDSEDENAIEEKLKLNPCDTEKSIEAVCAAELNDDEHDKETSSGAINVENCERAPKKNRCSVM